MTRDSGIQVLDRTVALLGQLGEAGENGLQLSRLATAIGLSASTTHRLLAALEHHGWVERDDTTRRHRLGPGLITLGGRAADHTGLRRLCRPALQRISARTGESTFLILRSGLNAVVLDRQEGSYVLESLTQGVGGHTPLGIGSGSLAILACQPADDITAILAANAGRFAPFNRDAGEIAGQLAEAQRLGHVQGESKAIQGLSFLAVAIRPPGRNVVAAIALNYITSRLDGPRRAACLALIRAEIAAIEARLSPPPGPTRSHRTTTLAPENAA